MLIFIVMITCGIVLATTFDTSVPPDTGESPSGGAERIRNLAAATREINNIEHYWPLDGDVVDDPDKGMHRKVEFQAQLVTPTIAADQGMLYIYDVNGGSGAKAELYWHGEDDYVLQMTELNAAGNAAALNITGTYENEVDFSNTGNAFNTDDLACTAGGLLTLPDDTTDTTESNLRYNTTDDVVEFRNASGKMHLNNVRLRPSLTSFLPTPAASGHSWCVGSAAEKPVMCTARPSGVPRHKYCERQCAQCETRTVMRALSRAAAA